MNIFHFCPICNTHLVRNAQFYECSIPECNRVWWMAIHDNELHSIHIRSDKYQISIYYNNKNRTDLQLRPALKILYQLEYRLDALDILKSNNLISKVDQIVETHLNFS